jgi:hypothetical protein
VGKAFSTVKQIEAFTEPGRYRDETTTGLYVSVRIGATGLSKSYVWRGRVGNNKEREIALGARRRDDQDAADRGPQLLEQAFPLRAEPIGGDNRQGDALQTDAAGTFGVFSDFNVVATAVQKPCELGS